MKVYCQDCTHYFGFISLVCNSQECNAEENKKYFDTWLRKDYKRIRHPKKINEYNDCRWFKK
jgi:hypothetical protein